MWSILEGKIGKHISFKKENDQVISVLAGINW